MRLFPVRPSPCARRQDFSRTSVPRNVHHVAPTLLIFNGGNGMDDVAVPPDGVSGLEFGMLVNASINSGCHCSDTGNTLPGATPHSSSSGTSSSSGRNSTYAIAQEWAQRAADPDQAAYQRALSSPGMSETRNIWWCCPPCTLQLPYDVPHAGSYCARLPLKTLAKTR